MVQNQPLIYTNSHKFYFTGEERLFLANASPNIPGMVYVKRIFQAHHCVLVGKISLRVVSVNVIQILRPIGW